MRLDGEADVAALDERDPRTRRRRDAVGRLYRLAAIDERTGDAVSRRRELRRRRRVRRPTDGDERVATLTLREGRDVLDARRHNVDLRTRVRERREVVVPIDGADRDHA